MKRKSLIIVALSLGLVLGLSPSAWAYSVTYPAFGALEGAYSAVQKEPGHAETSETYGAADLIAYNGSFAIVDQTSVPGETLYFDKVLNFNTDDVTTGQGDTTKFQTTWKVANTGPYTWSDYHFIVTGGAPIVGVEITGNQSADFKETNFTATEANFFATKDNKLVAPDETLNFTITFDPSGFYPLGGDLFVRQIATTPIPIPPSALLLGSGLLGLGLVGWRRRKS